jgi:hypothetical protein
MCGAALDAEATETDQVLYYGIHGDSVAITVYDGGPAVAYEFQDAVLCLHPAVSGFQPAEDGAVLGHGCLTLVLHRRRLLSPRPGR